MTCRLLLTAYLILASAGIGGCVDRKPTQPIILSPRLEFKVQPKAVLVGEILNPAVQVTVQDPQDNDLIHEATGVTLSLAGDPSGVALWGTLTQPMIAGIATFSDLVVNTVGASFALVASATGFEKTVSQVFPTSSYIELPDGTRALTASERTIVADSAAWSVLVPLRDGTVGMMFHKARPLSEINGVNASIEFVRSVDGRRTWSVPVTVHERLGRNDAKCDRTPDNGYVVYQSRNIAAGQLPSGRSISAFMLQDYHYAPDGTPRVVNGYTGNFEGKGVVYTYSDDLGATWSTVQPLDTGPFGIASPHWRIVSLPDGTALMSMYGTMDTTYKGPLSIPAGTRALAGVFRSTDNGATWGDCSLIMAKTSPLAFEETALALTTRGLSAYVRTETHNVTRYESVDLGRSWSGPFEVTRPGQQPGGAIELRDGSLLMTWGNRNYPYGAQAMFSLNGGLSWDYIRKIAIGWESPSPNGGYANASELADGTILVTWFSMPSSVEYRRLWSESVIHLARFKKGQLTAAIGYP